MKITGTINGLVRNADNTPMENVSIIIVNGLGHSDIAALTGTDGTFSFTNLQAGDYVIKAYGSEVESDDIQVHVLAKNITFVEIYLEADIVDEEENFVAE